MTWEPRNRNDDEKGDTLSDDDDCNDDHHSTNQTDNELPRQQNAVQEVVQGDNKAQPLDSKGKANQLIALAIVSLILHFKIQKCLQNYVFQQLSD